MNSSTQAPDTWSDQTLASLMEHIVQKHHSFCRQEVVRLGAMFKDAVIKHGKDYPELKRMQALFGAMGKELEMHLVKEEQTLFPYIARVEDAVQQKAPFSWPPFGTVENPIRMMVWEHDQTGVELKELRRLSNDYSAPSAAPDPIVALYNGLRAFELDMDQHVHAEDHLLFPRAIALEEQACTRGKPV